MAYESEGSLKLYLREISKTPLLTPEEEISLSERIKKGELAAGIYVAAVAISAGATNTE